MSPRGWWAWLLKCIQCSLLFLHLLLSEYVQVLIQERKGAEEFRKRSMSTEASDPLFAMFDAPMEQSGKLLLEVPMFPLLSTVHFIMTAIALRSEPGQLCAKPLFIYNTGSSLPHFKISMSDNCLLHADKRQQQQFAARKDNFMLLCSTFSSFLWIRTDAARIYAIIVLSNRIKILALFPYFNCEIETDERFTSPVQATFGWSDQF